RERRFPRLRAKQNERRKSAERDKGERHRKARKRPCRAPRRKGEHRTAEGESGGTRRCRKEKLQKERIGAVRLRKAPAQQLRRHAEERTPHHRISPRDRHRCGGMGKEHPRKQPEDGKERPGSAAEGIKEGMRPPPFQHL